MKTIIAGSRERVTYDDLLSAIDDCGWVPSVVLSGKAMGADTFGETWAKKNRVPVWSFPANWNLYGKQAGYLRNDEMAQKAEALIALWDGESKGTGNMINLAHKYGLRVYVHRVKYILS